jgi:predicted nucleotidyltransferase
MNEFVKNELDRIVNTLVGTGIVTKVILFGSYAKGEETPDSDLDLCVITPVKDKRPIDITIDLRMKLWDVQTMPLDLITCDQDNFSCRATYAGTLEREIAEHGVTVYEKVLIEQCKQYSSDFDNYAKSCFAAAYSEEHKPANYGGHPAPTGPALPNFLMRSVF